VGTALGYENPFRRRIGWLLVFSLLRWKRPFPEEMSHSRLVFPLARAGLLGLPRTFIEMTMTGLGSCVLYCLGMHIKMLCIIWKQYISSLFFFSMVLGIEFNKIHFLACEWKSYMRTNSHK
jgi:hypothetical protein